MDLSDFIFENSTIVNGYLFGMEIRKFDCKLIIFADLVTLVFGYLLFPYYCVCVVKTQMIVWNLKVILVRACNIFSKRKNFL